MSKPWFRFGHLSQSQDDESSHPASPATPASPPERAAESVDAPVDAPADAPTDAPTDAPPAAEHVERLPGMGQPIPTYDNTQTAGDWLSMMSQVTAVTAYKTLSFDLLDLHPGERVVDVGCGIGQDARELARRVGPDGAVVGVDGSEEMIARAIAATNVTDAETASAPRFVMGDATALPLETGAYDVLRADRLLQHVDKPLQALIEFRRVLRPGGRVVFVEPDWKTMAVYPGSGAGGEDDRCVAALFDWQVAHTRHPMIGRQLRMLLTLAGFTSVTVTPVAYASTSFLEADLALELSHAAAAAAKQWPARLSEDEVEAWRVTAQAAAAAGHFFASVPLFFAHAIVG
ncbi:MAG TPA: methyltransferase domain-containing protein [Ktedonobacterales bacterium]|nr:methyltransferase domain-containing protein [Ktedonobacterales bacterium]